jgi:hypothetical protein
MQSSVSLRIAYNREDNVPPRKYSPVDGKRGAAWKREEDVKRPRKVSWGAIYNTKTYYKNGKGSREETRQMFLVWLQTLWLVAAGWLRHLFRIMLRRDTGKLANRGLERDRAAKRTEKLDCKVFLGMLLA